MRVPPHVFQDCASFTFSLIAEMSDILKEKTGVVHVSEESTFFTNKTIIENLSTDN